MRPDFRSALFPLLLVAGAAHADLPPPIERVKLSDARMSCQQMYDEIEQMENVIALARQMQSGQTPNAGQAAAGQVAGAVVTEVAARSGFLSSLGGMAGQVLGTVAQQGAATAAGGAQPQDTAVAAERERQAMARKEYLTEKFLGKGCSAEDPSAPPKKG